MPSTEVAISCHDLTKRYRLGATGSVRRREDFYALRDVSFEIRQGEVIGVVGRNGAGKSTLLKILSRIVRPTRGHALLRGRLSGLLEVGTGFHPELTGRENIFLNGTIMGMTRREVQREFASIVDFGGISYFLDTPIKRYSSGMYVRLAFAVAAHLRSEILVLDEVLAVGDAAFQRKCLGKVQELAHEEGRTVLLVSHNATVIRQNATRALRLEGGRLTTIGSVQEVLREAEERDSPAHADVGRIDRIDENWGRLARILSVEVKDQGRVTFGQDLEYQLVISLPKPIALGVGQAIVTPDDVPVATSFSSLTDYEAGTHCLNVRVPAIPLAPGRYAMNIVVGQSSFAVPDLHYDGVLHAVGFEVLAPDEELVDWHPEWWGLLALTAPEITRVSQS